MKLVKSNVHTQIDETIHIDGEIIDKVDNFKYLGVVIDHKLKFHMHVNYIIGF